MIVPQAAQHVVITRITVVSGNSLCNQVIQMEPPTTGFLWSLDTSNIQQCRPAPELQFPPANDKMGDGIKVDLDRHLFACVELPLLKKQENDAARVDTLVSMLTVYKSKGHTEWSNALNSFQKKELLVVCSMKSTYMLRKVNLYFPFSSAFDHTYPTNSVWVSGKK